ncbi:MAG: DUF61 family protein [Ignisphaera sp.]|uniref:UPF0216 protein ENU08_07770 n=1 Tax=Ignisphaera aggregans TaxID=334771 RepID=A0A7C4NLQ5_9CREN
MSEVIDKLLQAELRIVNKHLPASRKSLKQLLDEKIPYVLCRDGSIHVFRRSELQMLKTYVSDDEASRLYLPIVIQVRADMDIMTGFVENELEASIIRRILGLKPPLEGELKKLFLYKPQLYELRYKFSTIFQLAIIADLDSVDIPPSGGIL